jgi:hypothetical protein
MTTLYIRDVPQEVATTLKERAAAEGKPCLRMSQPN